jgi:hypothetical protein
MKTPGYGLGAYYLEMTAVSRRSSYETSKPLYFPFKNQEGLLNSIFW